MKSTILWMAMSAVFLTEGAVAQTSNAGSNSNSGSSSNSATTSNTVNQPQATANSNQSTNAVSGSSSYGNVGNTTTNTMTPTANSNANSQTASQSNSTNAGNSQTIIFNPASVPAQTTSNGRMENVLSGSTTSNVNSNSRSENVLSGTTTSNINSTSRSENVLSGEQTVRHVNSGEQTIRYEYSGTQTVKNVPSINAAPLTSSNDTCMGSFSAGVSVPGLGLTGGATYTDEHCKRIKMSRELWNKGMKAASLAIDCMDRDAREALELTGFVCPQTLREQRAATAAAEIQAASSQQYTRVAYYPPPLPPGAQAPQPAVEQAALPSSAPLPPSAAPAAAAPEPLAPVAAVPVPVAVVTTVPLVTSLPDMQQAELPAAPAAVTAQVVGDDSVPVRRVDLDARPASGEPATR